MVGRFNAKPEGRLRTPKELQFDPVGKCIYCGAQGVVLKREHVMPIGMRGEMVLPKASCEECETITGRIENFVLGRMLIALRIRYELKSRKGKRNQRPQVFEIEVTDPFKEYKKTEEVNNDYLPWMTYGMPRYKLPGILRNVSAKDAGEEATLEAFVSEYDVQNMVSLGKKSESVKWPVGPQNFELFAQFLAKVAHSYLFATLGEENFTPLLNEIILNAEESPYALVGCQEDEVEIREDPAPYLFEVSHGDAEVIDGPLKGLRLIIVRIRLFSFLGTPTYIVVAGGYRCDEKWLFEQPVYGLRIKATLKWADGKPAFSIGV